MRALKKKTYLGNANEHVSDQRVEGGNGACVLVLSVPHSDSNENTLFLAGGSVQDAHVDGHVAQVFGNGTSGASNSDLSGFNGDLDCRN